MAKLKLFKVSRIESIVMLALSEQEAQAKCDNYDWGDPYREITVAKVTPADLKHLMPDWEDAIPIGNPDDNPASQTCGEILKAGLKTEKKPQSLTIKLLAGPEDDGKIAALWGVIRRGAKDLKLNLREE